MQFFACVSVVSYVAFVLSLFFSTFLLVSGEVFDSRLRHFLGIFTYIFSEKLCFVIVAFPGYPLIFWLLY